MTSPHIDKPESSSDVYEDVHSRGSSFGQDLKGKNIREMLMGREKSKFIDVAGLFGNAVNDIGQAIEWGIQQIFGSDEPKGPPPPMYEDLAAAIKRAMTPVHSMADEAIDTADQAQEKAESLTEGLTGSVNGDLHDAVANFSGIVGEIAKKAEDALFAATGAGGELDQALEDMRAAQKGVENAVAQFQDTKVDVESAASSVEAAVEEYKSKVVAAEKLLTDVNTAKDAAEGAAGEVSALVGTPEWDEAVAKFAWAQDQVNLEQSEFNQGVNASLKALAMVQEDQSDFNQGVTAALGALDMVQQKQSDFNQGVQKATEALQKFQHWQLNFNSEVAKALEEQAGVNDVNEINWQTTSEYLAQNDKINRAQTEGIAWHENQMNWSRWTRVQHWWVGAYPYSDGNFVTNLEIRETVGLTATHVKFKPTKGWRGHVTGIARYGDFSAMDIWNWQIDGSGDELIYYAGGRDLNYTSAVLIATPYWAPAPREYLLKSHEEEGGSGGYGFSHTEAYFNELEQNPLTWNYQDSVLFRNCDVKPDKEVWYYHSGDAAYYRSGPGVPIAKGTYIKAFKPGVVKFTEIR